MKVKEQFGSELNKLLSKIKDSAAQLPNAGEKISSAIEFASKVQSNESKKTKKTNMKKSKQKKMDLPIGKLYNLGKLKEDVLFEISKQEIDDMLSEKWSQKYKDSIDCKNPKGFSQKAHCQGKKKETKEEVLKGGKGDNKTFTDLVNKYKKHIKNISNIEVVLKKQLNKGIKVEMEHTKDKEMAKEIAMDHLFEDPKYYDKLEKVESKESTGSGSAGGFMGPVGFNPQSDFVKRSFKETPKKIETKEATGTSSAGSYVTTAAWAKTMNKKDWRGKSKTQIPGGQFVQVKKKCKKFPYCNQGDIKALNLSNESQIKKVAKNVSEVYNISENLILEWIIDEFNKNSQHK